MREKEANKIYQIINKTFRRANFEYFDFDEFVYSQGEIKFYHIKRPAIFHRKLILIDSKILLLGSCNYLIMDWGITKR